MLTKEIGGLRKLITSHKHENDRLKENLRIKERELAVQYEENDRLTYNYDRLKKRVGSLQSELKEKVPSIDNARNQKTASLDLCSRKERIQKQSRNS